VAQFDCEEPGCIVAGCGASIEKSDTFVVKTEVCGWQLIGLFCNLVLPEGAEGSEESLEDGRGNGLAALVFGVKGVAVADLGDMVVLRGSC
jgi:hypothetical protein